MKGIILKDLYDNFCIPKNLAAYILGFLVIPFGFILPSAYYYTLIAGMILPMLGGCALEYPTEQEEASNFNKLLITFPVSKAQIVTAKYLLGLGFVLVCDFLSLLCSMVQVYIHHTIRLAEALRIWAMGVSISLIFLSVIYVGYFLLGKRWGSIFFIITICLFSFGWGLSSVLVGIEALFNLSYGLVFCLILAGAVIMTLSCLASIRIYSRKYS